MTAQPSQEGYTPLFVSEVTGPPPYDDCLPDAGLMALGCWTNGEVFLNPDWTQMSPMERVALAEHLRNQLPNRKQTGYLNTADLDAMKEGKWPYLPPVPRYFDPSEYRTWDQVLALLRGGAYGGLALGDPSRAPKDSKLRRWTAGDHYQHFIWLDRANADTILVLNPLAPFAGTSGPGAYEGERIPISEVKAFVNFDSGKHAAVSMYKRGDQSTQAITARGYRQAASTAAAASKAALDAAAKRIAELEAQAPPPADCTDAVTAAVAAATAPLQAVIDKVRADVA